VLRLVLQESEDREKFNHRNSKLVCTPNISKLSSYLRSASNSSPYLYWTFLSHLSIRALTYIRSSISRPFFLAKEIVSSI